MSYKITISSDEDFKWLASNIKKNYEKSLNSPELYLLYCDMYKRLHEDLEAAERIKDDQSIFEEPVAVKKRNTPAKKTAPMKSAAKPAQKVVITDWNYCKEHGSYSARRSPRTSCQSCWDAYDRLNNSGVESPQRREFFKKLNEKK